MNNNKNYLITFGVSFLVMFTISVIVFMLMLPKQSSIAKGTIKNYDNIVKSEYTFEATKAISAEPLKRQYSITGEDMSGFKSSSQYKAGNTDPFTVVSSDTGTTTKKTTTQEDTKKEAEKRTSNSNGGVSNPPSTKK